MFPVSGPLTVQVTIPLGKINHGANEDYQILKDQKMNKEIKKTNK